jgi:hypothetical protein
LTLGDVALDPGQHALTVQTRSGQVTIREAGGPLTCAVCAFAAWRELIDTADQSGTAAVRAAADAEREAPGHLLTCPDSGAPGRATLPLLRRIRRGGTITSDGLTPQVITQVLRGLAARTAIEPAMITGLSLRATGQLDRLLAEAAAIELAASAYTDTTDAGSRVTHRTCR